MAAEKLFPRRHSRLALSSASTPSSTMDTSRAA